MSFDQRNQQVGTQYNAGRDINIHVASPLDARQKNNRRKILKRVKNIWIDGFLDRSIAAIARIELGLSEKYDVLDLPLNMQYQELNKYAQPVLPGVSIFDMFMRKGENILILGDPGAGKTTMLLELARELINMSEENESHPVPIIFNLSSISSSIYELVDRRRVLGLGSPTDSDLLRLFVGWFIKEMASLYKVSEKISLEFLLSNQLILLLDGLDEVKLGLRDYCIRSINEFHQKYSFLSIAVCSRIAEYQELITRLKLQGAVMIAPLTPRQIDNYLSKKSERLEGLRKALNQDTVLKDIAKTPLMLEIMIIVYKDKKQSELWLSDSVTMQRRYIFDTYIDQMLSRRRFDVRFPSGQVIRKLNWLARNMTSQELYEFDIKQLQPGWLNVSLQRWIYRVSVICASILISVLVYMLIFGLVGVFNREIMRGFVNTFSTGVHFGLSVGFLVGLGIGLIILNENILPNAGVVHSIHKSLLQSVLVSVSLGISGSLLANYSVGFVFGLLGGLFILILGILIKNIHWIIRVILWKFSVIPWDYEDFFDYCVDHILLNRIGSKYVFIHRLLMEHFASLGEDVGKT